MSSNVNLTKERLATLRLEYKRRHVRGKYPRQKMLPEYQSLYPWVLPDETDPYYAFCTVCECRLSAKRCDLGKHECSIKHTENASKKIRSSKVYTGNTFTTNHTELQIKMESTESAAEVSASDSDGNESNNEGEGYTEGNHYKFVKKEQSDALDTNANELKLPADNICTLDSQAKACGHVVGDKIVDKDECDDDSGNSDGDDDGSYDDDHGDDVQNHSPLLKSISSDADYLSQHSTKLDGMPIQVTAGDGSTEQRFSIREMAPPRPYTTSSIYNCSGVMAQYKLHKEIPSLTTPIPCKLTIKKIASPITTPSLRPSSQAITPATIMPVSSALSFSRQHPNQIITNSTSGESRSCQDAAIPTASSVTSTTLRDSFDLFFASICASVKALPPKLATESKIRVMQLIGELEMRAITELEQSQSVATGQQNSTVASTTK